MKSDSRSNEILRCISKLRVAACAIGIAAVSGLAGCASVDVSSPAAVTSGVVVKRDDFKKLIEYRAPFMQLGFGDGAKERLRHQARGHPLGHGVMLQILWPIRVLLT